MAVTVIIAGGGRGTRMASAVAKQFLEIQGKPILFYTLKKFEQSSAIDNIVLTAPADSVGRVRDIVEKFHISKIRAIVAGGNSRQESVGNGLKKVSEETTLVAIHDAVRPFVSERHIRSVVEAARENDAAILAVPVKDTVKIAVEGEIRATPDRRDMWLAQTPQVFSRQLIIRAYRRAAEENFIGTDDASLAERLGVTVRIVEGSYANIKITTPFDLEIAELVLRKNLEAG
ncbi:MAG: 2-C-methyl-D-erythritol 4-phosphate cytidylyltransferase [Calditrichaeota bacterium]|nr:2-C-methyl-D-erythritol 4-phosphate cytidylyltransferase [Calditrichota bacterium]